MTDRATVDGWLGAYVAAWKSYDAEEISALFAEDVAYRYHPYDEPIRGRDAVVAAWREDEEFPGASGRDEPGAYEGSYSVVTVDGDVAVAVGTSTYTDGPDGPVTEVYDNCFLLRFDAEERCCEFTEWFMKRPTP